MTGMFAISLAGHDKGRMYVIIKDDGEYVYLADGNIRPFERPKKKKRKHHFSKEKNLSLLFKTKKKELKIN